MKVFTIFNGKLVSRKVYNTKDYDYIILGKVRREIKKGADLLEVVFYESVSNKDYKAIKEYKKI